MKEISVTAALVRHQEARLDAITKEFERLVCGGDWSLADAVLNKFSPAVAFKLGVSVAMRHRVGMFDLKQFCGLTE